LVCCLLTCVPLHMVCLPVLGTLMSCPCDYLFKNCSAYLSIRLALHAYDWAMLLLEAVSACVRSCVHAEAQTLLIGGDEV
jgi:hypothetical protein